VVRSIVFAILLTASSGAALADATCALDPNLPESWQPPAELRRSLSPAPWSPSEARDAENAVEGGIDEMIGLFRRSPPAVRKLYDDSIAALLQALAASANKPELDAKILKAARANLTALLEPFLARDAGSATCDEFEDQLPLAIFAHRLYPPQHKLTDAVTRRTNAAYRACGSLEVATEGILKKVQTDNQDPEAYLDRLEDLFDLYAWALLLIEAELYPDIELPAEARAFGEAAWKQFETLALREASKFAKGVKDERFITLADLATHLSHIPTGLGRFPLHVSDKPDLFTFLRENFYPMMQSGDRDLFALFVDTLRQYGCTPENDTQVRDGTRYLLEDYRRRGGKWMNYHEARKSLTDPIEYVRIHHAWTAVLGIRDRRLKPPEPGTYGSLVRRWLPPPPQRN
jgi:hypothetical protein